MPGLKIPGHRGEITNKYGGNQKLEKYKKNDSAYDKGGSQINNFIMTAITCPKLSAI